ncbi:MAG: hypothetical protein WC289_05940, partial [Patescibacteria group bacterium]
LSWQEYQKMLERAAKKMRGHRYNAIYGIPRGGLPIAVSLSHLCMIPLTMQKPKRASKKILVVDDISDTGRSIAPFGGFSTFSLFIKPTTSFIPDYYIKKTPQWIVFPWETKNSSKYDNTKY